MPKSKKSSSRSSSFLKKLLEPFLQENEDRLKFVFLPPYSPKLNLIEGL
ncbi:transposase [Anaerobacterium chartisolvens]